MNIPQQNLEAIPPGTVLRPVWADMRDGLRNQNIKVRELCGDPPYGRAASTGWPRELLDLLELPHIPIDPSKDVDSEPLGLFVPDRDDRTLPVGVHLFADRIARAERAGGLPPGLLAWAVLWHEFTHAAVETVGQDVPPAHLFLRPVSLDELLCETTAVQGLETGRHPMLPLSGPAFSAGRAAYEAWSRRRQTLPYALFPNALPSFEAVGTRVSLLSAVGFRQLGPHAFDLSVGDLRHERARQLVRSAGWLALGRLTPADAQRVLYDLAASAQVGSRPPEASLQFPVYLWNGHTP